MKTQPAPARADAAPFRRTDLLWLAAAVLIIVGSGIGWRHPWPADEPGFVQVAREMAHHGHWLFPSMGGELYGDKPPLYFWLLAAGFELTGSIRWTFLLPSLLAALGIVGLTYDRPVVDFGHRRGLDPLAEAEDASRWLDAAPRRVLLVPRAVIRGACCTTRRRPARLPILRSAIAERVWYFPAASLKTPIASKDPR